MSRYPQHEIYAVLAMVIGYYDQHGDVAVLRRAVDMVETALSNSLALSDEHRDMSEAEARARGSCTRILGHRF
ncbi:hypothetical protein SAMN05421854_12476 [Amycolatopsis rubida]|uniref:Uncharacterized protein n=1 Tax=Amycolatopsis rubida TaxID=112413 RepID=A0A1I6B9U1_9PSEU|nr:hypothetical protein SAMN05421854_12476 [Amycolatopsis rubida]